MVVETPMDLGPGQSLRLTDYVIPLKRVMAISGLIVNQQVLLFSMASITLIINTPL